MSLQPKNDDTHLDVEAMRAKDGIQVICLSTAKVGIPPTPTAPSITEGISEWNLKASIQPVWKYPATTSPSGDVHRVSETLSFCHPWRNIATVNQWLKKNRNPHQVTFGRLYSFFTWLDNLIHPFVQDWNAIIGHHWATCIPAATPLWVNSFFQHKETVLAVFANGPTKFWAPTASLELMLSISSKISLSSQIRLFPFFHTAFGVLWEGGISKGFWSSNWCRQALTDQFRRSGSCSHM